MCKISLWSVEYISNQSTVNFGRISNSIEILLVGRVPGVLRETGMGVTKPVSSNHNFLYFFIII